MKTLNIKFLAISLLFSLSMGVFLWKLDMHKIIAIVNAEPAIISVVPEKKIPPQFVTREGSDLYLNNEVFRFLGVNSYDLTYLSEKEIDQTLDAASQNGITVIRFWVFGDGISHGFQPAPYKYNDRMFRNTGYIISAAEKRDIKLILTLSNFWGDYGGVPQYLGWSKADNSKWEPTDNFYSNAEAIKIFKSYIEYMLNYVNPVSGMKFKDEPAIMAWEIMNEPRVYGREHTDTFLTFIREITRYIQSLDSYHLVSSGSEGFTQTYNDYGYEPTLEYIAGSYPDQILSGHYYLGENPYRAPLPVIKHWKSVSEQYHLPVIIGEVGFDKRKDKVGGVNREKLLSEFLDHAYTSSINGVILWNWALKIDNSYGISPVDPADREYLSIISEYGRKFHGQPL